MKNIRLHSYNKSANPSGLLILSWLMVLMPFFAKSQETTQLWYPSSVEKIEPIQRTSFQKGIGLSTDIIAAALPTAALVVTVAEKDWQGLKQAAFTALVAGGTTYLLKFTVRELRPDHSSYTSFPSMHSATTFATAAYLQRRYGWKFGAPAYALATYTAVGRVLAKKHHWWDVVVGSAIGAGSAYIFTTPWAKKHEFSMAPAATDTSIGVVAQMTF